MEIHKNRNTLTPGISNNCRKIYHTVMCAPTTDVYRCVGEEQEKEMACLARRATFPEDGPADNDADPELHKLCITSHGSFAPGDAEVISDSGRMIS